MKFGRKYKLSVQTGDTNKNYAIVSGSVVPVSSNTGRTLDVEIEYPLTLEFNVNRSTLSNSNTGNFKIYNLSEKVRRSIFHDRYDTLNYKRCVLQAGYEGDPQLPTIFDGNIQFAQSYRQKQDWITEIEGYDGYFGMANGQVSNTFSSSLNMKQILTQIIKTIPNVTLGVIGDIGSSLTQRGSSVSGNSWEIINSLVPDAVTFIDSGKLNILNKNEYIRTSTDPLLITSSTGLLGTPRRGKNTIELKMLFEPRLFVGQLVEVRSELPYYNGQFVVQGVSHQGTISGAVSGDLFTDCTVFAGTEKLQGV